MLNKILIYSALTFSVLNFTACSTFSTLMPQEQTESAIKSLEGKFSFKSNQNNGAGLFIWEQYTQGWILTLQTPIATNLAKVTYGNVPQIIGLTPIYAWEDLPLVKQGITLTSDDFTNIMYNINNPEKLKQVLQANNWQIIKHEISQNGTLVEITKDDIVVKFFVN